MSFVFIIIPASSSLSLCLPLSPSLLQIFIKHLVCFTKKAMAPYSSTLAWKIPWMEEPGWLQSMGSLRVRHDWATSLSLFTFMHWRGKWQPTPVFLPGEPREGGAWWAAIYGVAQSRTWLKRLSSSSSSVFHVERIHQYILSNSSCLVKDLIAYSASTFKRSFFLCLLIAVPL